MEKEGRKEASCQIKFPPQLLQQASRAATPRPQLCIVPVLVLYISGCVMGRYE